MSLQPVGDNIKAGIGVCFSLMQSLHRRVKQIAHRQQVQSGYHRVCDQQAQDPHVVSGDAHVSGQAPGVGDGAAYVLAFLDEAERA